MNSDEELDFTSKKFNANKVLELSNVKVPEPTAKEYEHLDEFRTAVHSHDFEMDKLYGKIKGVTGPGGVPLQRVKKKVEKVTRNFTTEQAPIQGVKKNVRNVLTRMEKTKGPLAVLKTCKEKDLKVKVYTRNHVGVRGILTGYVIAYDKHWNMVLRGVEETFVKKIRNPKASLGDVSDFVTVADLSIQEKDDCYVEPSPLMSAKRTYTTAAEEPEPEQQGRDTVFYARMMKRLGQPVPGPKSVKPKQPESSSELTVNKEHKDEPTSQPEVKSFPESQPSSFLPPPPAPKCSDFSKFKIPKKTFKAREPPGLYESEDKRSQGIRLHEHREDKIKKEGRDSRRLHLSHQASVDMASDCSHHKPETESKSNVEKMKSQDDDDNPNKRKRRRKKYEIRQRVANQLLIRGEQVVLVAVADSHQL